MKLYAFHFAPHGIARAYSHIVAGLKLCRATKSSMKGLIPESVPCMTAGWNFYDTLMLHNLIAPRTIIDIGANVSQMTKLLIMACENKAPKIISFEPNPELMPLGEVHRTALSNIDGDVSLYLPFGDNAWGTIEPHELTICEKTSRIKVKCSRFSTLIDEGVLSLEALPRPILVKIDTEGAEKKVLEGFGKHAACVDYFLIEVENRESLGMHYDFLSLARLVDSAGFTNSKILYSCYDGPAAPAFSDVLFWRKG